jgi:hypothetical protein
VGIQEDTHLVQAIDFVMDRQKQVFPVETADKLIGVRYFQGGLDILAHSAGSGGCHSQGNGLRQAGAQLGKLAVFRPEIMPPF